MRIILLISLLLSTSIVFAQNDNAKTSSEKYNQKREKEFEKFKTEYGDFEKQREKEFEKFKSDYEAAFKKFKKNYGQFLDEEEEMINIMSSDDNLPIKPISLKHNPKVESTAAKEIQKINIERKNLSKISASEFLVTLTNSKDGVEQLKEGTEKLNEINKAFETTPKREKVENVSKPIEEIKKIEKETVAPPIVKQEDIIPSGKPTNYTRISSPFGNRIHPINRKQQYHKGIDLKAQRMTPIKATADGIITYAKRNSGYGNFVKINHQSGYKTAYAHLHRISAKLNAEVKKGDIIGYVGSTGRSTGDHLHYEVYYQDKLIDPAKTF